MKNRRSLRTAKVRWSWRHRRLCLLQYSWQVLCQSSGWSHLGAHVQHLFHNLCSLFLQRYIKHRGHALIILTLFIWMDVNFDGNSGIKSSFVLDQAPIIVTQNTSKLLVPYQKTLLFWSHWLFPLEFQHFLKPCRHTEGAVFAEDPFVPLHCHWCRKTCGRIH